MTGWWFGTMEFYDFPIILGMSSSQLTNSIIFQRGRSTTNQIITVKTKSKQFPVDVSWNQAIDSYCSGFGVPKQRHFAMISCRPGWEGFVSSVPCRCSGSGPQGMVCTMLVYKSHELYRSGWWFGTFGLFSHNILGIMVPSDFHIFQRSWNHQPADVSWCIMMYLL